MWVGTVIETQARPLGTLKHNSKPPTVSVLQDVDCWREEGLEIGNVCGHSNIGHFPIRPSKHPASGCPSNPLLGRSNLFRKALLTTNVRPLDDHRPRVDCEAILTDVAVGNLLEEILNVDHVAWANQQLSFAGLSTRRKVVVSILLARVKEDFVAGIWPPHTHEQVILWC
jgi:hypothetical protein